MIFNIDSKRIKISKLIYITHDTQNFLESEGIVSLKPFRLLFSIRILKTDFF